MRHKNNNVHELQLQSENKHDETLKKCKQATVQIHLLLNMSDRS